jgi:hypothetical protein
MNTTCHPVTHTARFALILIVGAVCALSPARLSAKPAPLRSSCGALEGVALRLCHAYCDAQHCDVRSRPSCAVLRRVLQRLTGSEVFPCDAVLNNADARRRLCGDGKVNPHREQCDPPGSLCANGQLCNNDCMCPAPLCGNGQVDAGEQCDASGPRCADGQACNADCTCPPALCGNGQVDAGEECDPAGLPCPDGQACNADCTCPAPLCGNGTLDPGEECDPAAGLCSNGQPCDPDCTCAPIVCGNGRVDVGEACDPPGSQCTPGGVCSPDCTCRGPNPECQSATCDNFLPCDPAASCAFPVCGTTAEGGGLCVDGDTQCDLLLDCTTSSDCPMGSLCVVESCCLRSVCVPDRAYCPVP